DRDTVIVDASHLVGAVPVEAAALGADFVAFACDKWLLGPEQTAALWIGPRVRTSAVGVSPSAGLPRTAVLGLARSVGWIEMYVGLDFVYSRTKNLVAALAESLQILKGVRVERPHPAVVTFTVEGWPIGDVVDELRRRGFAIVSVTPD